MSAQPPGSDHKPSCASRMNGNFAVSFHDPAHIDFRSGVAFLRADEVEPGLARRAELRWRFVRRAELRRGRRHWCETLGDFCCQLLKLFIALSVVPDRAYR